MFHTEFSVCFLLLWQTLQPFACLLSEEKNNGNDQEQANLQKTSNITLEGLQRNNVPKRRERITTPGKTPLQEILRIFPECLLPSGATGSQSDGWLGVNCTPGVHKAFSYFTSTIQIPNRE